MQHILGTLVSGIILSTISFSALAQEASSPITLEQLREVRKSFVDVTVDSYSPSDEVTENFLRYSENGRAAIDVLLMQLYLSVQLPPEEVSRVMGLFDYGSGQWRDINYADRSRGGWDVTLHVTRIYALAKSYRHEGSPYHNSPELSRLLHRAALWWFETRPVNPNWWHNDIGVPKKLTAAMLLLRDELSEDEIQGTLKVLERSRFGRTGQNKTWLAGNQMMKALLIEDTALAEEARKQIAEEIYITEDEGIQPDWSFHQHGPQLQFGNYGLAYAEGVSFWARVLNGTALAFSSEQVDILENFILNGLCWTVWDGLMDPNACGRQLHIDGCRGKAYSCAVAIENMAAMGRPESGKLRHIALQNLQPELYGNELVGAMYYPRSDFGIFRTRDWYASVRMQSERTIGYEFTNAENQKAQFSADGTLLLMQSGKEYENIFPLWDWRLLPGVTAYYDGQPFRTDDSREDKQNSSLHVGGLAGDALMVTAMEVERHGLHALKADFFFDDMVISLGSDIRASRPEITRITTALDQNLLDGSLEKGSYRSKTHGNTDWVWHNGRGYVSLDGNALHSESSLQKGNWSDMAPMYDRVDSAEVFKCWIEHPADNVSSYAYALLPCRSAAETEGFAKAYSKGKKSTVTVLRNDDLCQAVLHENTICAVVHRGGTFSFCGHGHVFTDPGIYIIKEGKTVSKTALPPVNADRK